MKNKKAFTLIELLVSIAIISILSGVVILGLQDVRRKANDTKRLSDLKEVQIAAETYKSVNSIYPESINDLVPLFISKLPTDPSAGIAQNKGYLYSASANRKSFCFKIVGTVYNAASQKDLMVSETDKNSWKICNGPDAGSL